MLYLSQNSCPNPGHRSWKKKIGSQKQGQFIFEDAIVCVYEYYPPRPCKPVPTTLRIILVYADNIILVLTFIQTSWRLYCRWPSRWPSARAACPGPLALHSLPWTVFHSASIVTHFSSNFLHGMINMNMMKYKILMNGPMTKTPQKAVVFAALVQFRTGPITDGIKCCWCMHSAMVHGVCQCVLYSIRLCLRPCGPVRNCTQR